MTTKPKKKAPPKRKPAKKRDRELAALLEDLELEEDAELVQATTRAVEAYAEARREEADLAAQKTEAGKVLEKRKRQVVTLLQQQGLDSVKVAGLASVRIEPVVKVSTIAAKFEELVEYLKENGHGAIVKESVHAGTLSKWFREELQRQFDAGTDQDFKGELVGAGLVSAYDDTKLVYTPERAKKAKATVA